MQIFEWLDEEGFAADASTYESKLKELKDVTRPVYIRVDELKKRPEAIAALESSINGSRGFVLTIKNMTAAQPPADSEEPPVFTPVEIETLERVVNETEVSNFCFMILSYFLILYLCSENLNEVAIFLYVQCVLLASNK